MKIWVIQTVLSPYRIPLFERLAQAEGVDFRLLLLSDRFWTRPQWRRDLGKLTFAVEVPFGLSVKTGPEKEFCVNPFLLVKLLLRRPDVVICGGYGLATALVLLASLISSVRYVIWTEATKHTDGWIRGPRLWLRRLMVRHAAAVVDAGTRAREYIEYLWPEIPRSRLFRAFNCVEAKRFMCVRREDPPIPTMGLPRRNMLFVGKLNERKGVPQLLEVYRLVVRQSGTEPGLILIGEGELREQVQRYKEEHQLRQLRVAGWVENEATARYYGVADVFMLLSKSDHNPLVIFEALSAGVPIVCSKWVCNAIDFIRDGVNGYIVDPTVTHEVVTRTLEVLAWDSQRRIACERYSRKVVRKANYRDAAKAFVAACTRRRESEATAP